MDNNSIILDDSAKASSNMDLYPNKDENKSRSELPIHARTTKDETQVPMSNSLFIPGNKISSSSCGADTIGGNALLVNVQNSNEHALKAPQESMPRNSYQTCVNNAPTFPSSIDPENTSMNMLSSNIKTKPTMASSISSNSNYNKSHLPQDADHGDSNKHDTSKATFQTTMNHNMTGSLKECENVLKSEKINSSELNEKCDPTSRMEGYAPVRTEISDKRDNHLSKETAKHAGVIEDNGVEPMVKSSQVSVVSNKLPLQSQIQGSKSEALQNSLSLNAVDGNLQKECVRKNITDSTTNSCFPPPSLKGSTSFDIKSAFDTSKLGTKSLAALDQAIAEKKATAMLPINKLSPMPTKSTASYFGGSGGMLDGLLKQAEARAAKEASVAAAAASAKKTDTKEDVLKDTVLPPSDKANKTETYLEKSSTADNGKGNLNLSEQINDVDGKGRSISKPQSDNTPGSKPVAITSDSSTVFGHKQQYPNDDTNTSNLGSSKSTSCLSTKSTETKSSKDALSQSTPHCVQKIGDANLGGVDATRCNVPTNNSGTETKTSQVMSSTKFLSSNTPPSDAFKLQQNVSDIPSKKEVPMSVQEEKNDSVPVMSSPTKTGGAHLLNREESHYKKDNMSSSSPLKRDFILPEFGSKDIGSPERKRFKSGSADTLTCLPSSQTLTSSVKLSNVSEQDNNKECGSSSKHTLSESQHASANSSAYKNVSSTSEGSSSKHLFKPKSDSSKDSVEEAMGKLFGSTAGTPTKCGKNEGVTISPVKSKDLGSSGLHGSSSNTSSSTVHSHASRPKLLPSSGSDKPSASSTVTSSSSSKGLDSRLPSSPGANTGSSIGSVTITKLSTGSSLNVKSKDLKNILSASNSDSKSSSLECNKSNIMAQASKNFSKAHGMQDISFDNNGYLKIPKVDLVPVSSIEGSSGNHQIGGIESSSLSIQSIGEKQGGDSVSRKVPTLSPNSDSSTSSISSISSSGSSRLGNDDSCMIPSSSHSSSATKSKSRSNSPGRIPSIGGSSTAHSAVPYSGSKKSSTPSMVSSGTNKSNIPSNKLSSSADSQDQRNKSIKCKLIRDSKDELHIEGRPKLSIRKVPTPESGAIVTSPSSIPRNPPGGSISIVPERKSCSAGGGKPMAKLKLSEDNFKRDRDPMAMSKNSSSNSSSCTQFNKTIHQNKRTSMETNSSLSMSSLSTSSSTKHSSSLSIVSASSSGSTRSISTSNIKSLNFPSHHNHGGKPITMKSSFSSNSSKSTSSLLASNMATTNVSKTLSASSPTSTKNTSSDFSKNEYSSGSKLKIKLSVASSNTGNEGKSSSSDACANNKVTSDMAKVNSSSSHLPLEAKHQYMKGSGSNYLDCDNTEKIQKSSSTGPNSDSGLLGDHEPPSGFPSFEFAGKPTYSPSRVEPITSVVATTTTAVTNNPNVTTVQPTKESPRDASNKDSPASQADSGVFSIASSNSPSKDRDGGSMGSGSSGTASTSPDSPNRIDRMPASFDQSFSNPGSSAVIGGSLNPSSRDSTTNWKPSATTQNQGDNLTGKQEAQQHSSSSSAFSKGSSVSDTTSGSKPSLSSEKSTFEKIISTPETSASSVLGSSKCSNQPPTSSSQLSFEESSKNNSQSGARGNTNPNSFQQQRQQALQQQQMMHQGYTNGPNPSTARSGASTDTAGYPSMYRPDGGTFPNVGGRPPYGTSGAYNQRNADFFAYNAANSTGPGIGRGGEPPAKRKRGRPRKAGMGGLPGDPTKPAKRSYVRKKKPESSQVDGNVSSEGSSRQPVAGMPQQRHRQGSSTFGSGSGSGEGGRGTDNIYNFDEEEFQDDSFGSLRMGQKKSSFSSAQTSSSGNNTNSNKLSVTGGFGSQDSSDDEFPVNNTGSSSSGMPSQSSSQISSQSGLKSPPMMNQQSSSNFTGMSAMGGRGGSSAMGNAMRQQPQYSANMGLRQQGPMVAGGRGNMMQTGMRGGMGGQMGQMHPQRMQNMQAQRMQMQSQQHMQQMQQQMGIEGCTDKEENAYSSEIVTKGSGIKLKIKLKKTAEEEAAAKKSRKRKPDDDVGSMNSNSPGNLNIPKPISDKFPPTTPVHGLPGNNVQGSMMTNSVPSVASTPPSNVNHAPSTMSGIPPNRPQQMQPQNQSNQPQYTAGMNPQQHQQQFKSESQQHAIQSNQYKMGQSDNRQATPTQPQPGIQNQQMNYQSQMGNKQVVPPHQNPNMHQQQQAMMSQQQMMQQQTANNQQQRNPMQHVHNQPSTMNPHPSPQGPQHNQGVSQVQQQNPNQMQMNKNIQQQPNSNLQRPPNMQNANQQMSRQASMDGSTMAHQNQMQQRLPQMNMSSPNPSTAAPMMAGANSSMRSPMTVNNPHVSPAASQPSAQGVPFNQNQGVHGNIPNSGMVNPFSQQQMLQQKQRQMMNANNSGPNNSPMNNLTNMTNMAQGNTGNTIGPASSQGNNMMTSTPTNKAASQANSLQGNNIMPGMNQANAGMSVRPNLPGHNYGMPGGMGMNMGPSNQGTNPAMNMGPNANTGQSMGGNGGILGNAGMSSPFSGGPNQFGASGPGANRMPIPYHMQQQQQGTFYGSGANQSAPHGNFGQNPMANNFMQMQQRQRMMAMQGMQNQFSGPNGMPGQFGSMGNQGSNSMEQFGGPMYNGPSASHPQFSGSNAMANNAMGGGMGPRPGMFNSAQQSQMGGFNAQQRMIAPGTPMGVESQQVPPHFRSGPGGPQGLGPNGMNNMGMHGSQQGPIGTPRISPSAMQKPMPGVGMGPMPGVGMPKISPQHPQNMGGGGSMGGLNAMQQSPQHQALQHNGPQLTPRHPTPLVSPQSMHSMHDSVNSPANANPLTPGGNGGPATPNQPQNQMTPQHYSNISSPIMNHSSMHNNPMTPQSHHMMTTSPHPSMTSPHPSMTSPHPSMGPSPSPRGHGGEPSHLYSGPSSAIAPSPQQLYHPSNNDDSQQCHNQQMMSPAHIGMQMKSPMMPMVPGTSNLRKIRRPSKPKGEAADEYLGNNGGQFGHQQLQQTNDIVPESTDVKEEHPQTPSANTFPQTPSANTFPQTPSANTFPQKPQTPRAMAFKEEEMTDIKSEPKTEIMDEIKQEEPEMPKFEAKWEELPNEVLARVFAFCVVKESSNTFLVKASKVCRKWWKVAMPVRYAKHCEIKDETEIKSEDGSTDKNAKSNAACKKDVDLWTHLDLSVSYLKEKHRNDKKLEWLLKKYPNVMELKLNGWKNNVNTSTLKLVAASKTIVSLSLVGCFKLSNEDLKLVGDTLPSLQRIDLSNVSASSCSSRSAVSSTALSDFITVLGERLTHFNISNNKMAGLPFVFKALSMHSKNLEDLDISNITTTSRDTILINMEKFQKGCPKLRVLNANHTMLSLVETPVKEQIQASGFPLLRELYIAVDSRGYFDGMDDGQIERVLKKSVDLRVLDVRGCQHVTESCLIRLPTWDIEKLVVAGCSAVANSSDGLELMVRKWAKGLRELDVSGTSGSRTINNAFEALIDSSPDTVIKKLNICSTSASLKPLTRLLKNCPTIEYLNLSSCRGLPRGMKRLYSTKENVLQLKTDILDGKFNGHEDSD